jgi:hypothetical protein
MLTTLRVIRLAAVGLLMSGIGASWLVIGQACPAIARRALTDINNAAAIRGFPPPARMVISHPTPHPGRESQCPH